jgi:GNAT superfamily N-acetyltransferase
MVDQHPCFYTNRPVDPMDLPLICSFPQTVEELFFMFPKASFPLTVPQLQDSINQRFDSTVILHQNQVIGFANFYRCEPGIVCTIGNVIVAPHMRGKGAGKYLIETMIHLAKSKHHVSDIQLSCFNTNTTGLVFYTRFGFKPFAFEERIDPFNQYVISIHMHFDLHS